MKHMCTVGYHPQLLVVLKLSKTDGAFSDAVIGIFLFLKLEDRDGADDGFVETFRFRGREVVGDEGLVVVSIPGKREAAEDIDSVPVEAAFNDEDVVKD